MKFPSFFVAGVVFASTLMPLATPVVLAAPAPTFTSKKDGYAIYLPGKPQAGSRKMALPNMGQMTVNFISVSKPPVAFVVIPMRLPGTPKGASVNQFLDGVERGFTMSTAAKLLSRKKISLGGTPGREILVQAGQNLMRGRFFVKGNRSYQVIAVSPKNGQAKYSAQIAQVLNSFRLLN
ncbi:hypothetical protein B1R32_10524 [Abditibacterium utsteinense]|uniref:Uncharacterized protein n=1 Tax=Abditibacterium utsteinense TaxID=1960156 RepID=A0A2S8SU63_9BACT|nr:hypothetical protein [Abditibacterium utsteinense]PQV64343.1 hypothetical protein B1R32_10524 [Abditibacterium utsteinense]